MDHVASDELPTLRMVTLRRLVSAMAPPLVLGQTASIGEVEAALHHTPDATVVVLVDAAGVLCGTLRREQLLGVDRDVLVESVMTRTSSTLEPEHDLDAARMTMWRDHVDQVLVVTAAGLLLGVVTDRDLVDARLGARRR